MGREARAALAPAPGRGLILLGSPWRSPARPHLPGAFYLRSFWLRKPSFIFSTTLASMELASLAKSRSRISDTGTETMAKASLSSLVGHVPSWEATGKQHHTDRATPAVSPPSATNPAGISDPVCPHQRGWGGLWVTGVGSRLVSTHPPLDHPGCFSPLVLGGKEHPKSSWGTGTQPRQGGGSGAVP